MAICSIFIILISILSVSTKLEEETYDLVIDFQNIYGRTGLFSHLTLETKLNNPENYFNLSDIENIFFDAKFIDTNNDHYNFTCNLWISDEEENFVSFCYLKEASYEIFEGNRRQIKLEEYIMYFADKKYKIFSSNYYYVFFTKQKEILFYSKNQTIDLDEEKDEYSLKFKIGGNYYNKDGLFLESIFLDNCTVEQNEKEMICNIPRIKLENIASPDKNLALMDLDCYYMEYICSFHSFIIMKHEKNIVKEDIYVEAIKLLNNDLDSNNAIAYETNVNNFPILEISNFFYLTFTNAKYNNYICHFKKNKNMPLLLICQLSAFNGNVILKEIKNLNISNIHIKYNFILSYNKNEVVRTLDWGELSNYVSVIYPQILNFTNEENINITMYSYECYYYGLKLNLNSPELQCSKGVGDNYVNYGCIVPKSHFNGLKSGNYFLYHRNMNSHSGNYINIFYEVTPFEVILPEESGNKSKRFKYSLLLNLFYLGLILI